jgi:hypothetical protein
VGNFKMNLCANEKDPAERGEIMMGEKERKLG